MARGKRKLVMRMCVHAAQSSRLVSMEPKKTQTEQGVGSRRQGVGGGRLVEEVGVDGAKEDPDRADASVEGEDAHGDGELEPVLHLLGVVACVSGCVSEWVGE